MPDPVDRLQAVADADGVESPPRAGREDPGVDLEMQVSVRVACPGGEVAYDGRLDLLDRHLHLAPSRSNTGRRVRGEPVDDLPRRGHLRGIVRIGDVGVQCRRERPGLRSVDGDLDEPHGLVVLAQPPLHCACLDVVSGDPSLVGRAVHVGSALDAIGGRDEVHGDPAALGEVVVVRAGPIGLDVVSSGGCCAAVDLHAAMHRNHPVNSHQQP